MKAIVILATTPDVESAKNIARHLVDKSICACVNIIPSCVSIYPWNNKIEETEEALLIIKTVDNKFDEVNIAIKSIHPYDLPEVIKFCNIEGDNDYLKWVCDTIGSRK